MEYAGVSDSTLIILALIAIVPPVLVAVLNRRNHQETRSQIAENTKVTEEVRHQVKNDHGTNLRDDLDGFKASVNKQLSEFKHSVETSLTDMGRQLESIESAQGYTGGVLGNVLGDIRQMKRTDFDTAKAVELVQESVRPLQEALDEYRAKDNKS